MEKFRANHLLANREYQLWVLMCVTRDEIFNIRRKEMSPLGISPMQVAILNYVQDNYNGITPAQLARNLFRAPHSVSGILSRMEKQGLVAKVKNLERKKSIKITLTEKGKKVLNQSTKKVLLQKIMLCLSDEEYQQLKSCLTKLHAEVPKYKL